MNINLANIDFCPGGKSATLTETTAEILLSETEKVILPPEGTDGFNKVTITHAPVEESVSATITSNGTHTISPSEGFGAMVGVSVDVNVPISTDADGIKYIKSTISKFPENAALAPRTGENCVKMFENCDKLITVPLFDLSQVTSVNGMFFECTSLEYLPTGFKISNKTLDTGQLFAYCRKLKSIPEGMFSNAAPTHINYMFQYCNSLTSIPLFDTSKVTDMYSVFEECNKIKEIPLFDTSNVTIMYQTFVSCSSLTSIPPLDTSNVTKMMYTFKNCSSLTTIPQLDTSKVINMNSMFSSCASLTTIPQLDTSKVTNMNYMFRSCSSLTSVPRLDATSLTDTDEMFGPYYYPLKKFTTFGGLTNLKVNLDLSPCTALTKESILNVFNEAADVTASPKTLTLGADNLAKLTDEEKAIATNKGWRLQ